MKNGHRVFVVLSSSSWTNVNNNAIGTICICPIDFQCKMHEPYQYWI